MTTLMTADTDFEPTSEAGASLMSAVEQLPVVSVPVDSLVPGFHLRTAGTDAAHVRMLAEAAGSVQLPPILAQKSGMRIIDGMHRVGAAKLRGERAIRARIVDCSDENALVLAVKSNTLHGLPLTRADRISSAKRILGEHPDWSDRKVAGIAGLSGKSIASLRNSSVGNAQFADKRLGRDGKRRPVVAAEGRLRAAEYVRAHPEASLRQIASETEVSVGTAHDVRQKILHGVDLRVAELSPQGAPGCARGPACTPARDEHPGPGHGGYRPAAGPVGGCWQAGGRPGPKVHRRRPRLPALDDSARHASGWVARVRRCDTGTLARRGSPDGYRHERGVETVRERAQLQARRSRLSAIAAMASHAAFALKRPDVGERPSDRSAMTCSMMAWSRCCSSAWSSRGESVNTAWWRQAGNSSPCPASSAFPFVRTRRMMSRAVTWRAFFFEVNAVYGTSASDTQQNSWSSQMARGYFVGGPGILGDGGPDAACCWQLPWT